MEAANQIQNEPSIYLRGRSGENLLVVFDSVKEEVRFNGVQIGLEPLMALRGYIDNAIETIQRKPDLAQQPLFPDLEPRATGAQCGAV